MEGGDSLPPTLYFITGSKMEAKEGGDSRLVLPTFQPTEGESSSIAVLSGLFGFRGAWLQSPGSTPQRLMLLSGELRVSLTKRLNT